jgi:hypothetical protein
MAKLSPNLVTLVVPKRYLRCQLYYDQGDQIGQIFAYWVVIYYGHFYED